MSDPLAPAGDGARNLIAGIPTYLARVAFEPQAALTDKPLRQVMLVDDVLATLRSTEARTAELLAEVEHWVARYNELEQWRAQTSRLHLESEAKLMAAESRLAQVEAQLTREREKHEEAYNDFLNKTSRLLDDERRRWYAALAFAGDLEGLAPEIVGERIKAERAAPLTARDQPLQALIAKWRERHKALLTESDYCGEYGECADELAKEIGTP